MESQPQSELERLRNRVLELERHVEELTSNNGNQRRRFHDALFSSVLENVQTGIVVCDAEGVLAFFNRATRAFHGLPEAPLPPEKWAEHYDLYHADGVTRMRTEEIPLFRALKEGVVENTEMVIAPKSGAPIRRLLASGRAIHSDEGQLLGAVVAMHDVTALKRINRELEETVNERTAALRESEARSAGILESIQDGFFALDSEWRFVYLNSAAERLLGERRQNLLARSHWEMYPDALGTLVEHEYRRAMQENVPVEFQNFYEPWQRWFSIKAAPTAEGGLSIYFRDITEAKLASEALQESEVRFRTMADSAPVLIWIADTHKGCTWFNRPWREFTGHTMEEEYGYGWADGIHPEDLDRCVATYNRSFDRREPFEMDYRLRRHDGEWRWVSDHGIPLTAGNGSFTGYIGSCIDITDRKKAEATLRESEERFREMADSAPVMVWVTEPNGVCTYLSRSWYEFTGQKRDEGAGLGWANAVHPDDKEKAKRAFLDSNATRTPYRVEFRLRHHSGEWRWAIDTAAPRLAPDGTFLGYVGSVLDINDRKKAEEALKASETHFRQVIDSMPQLVWSTLPNGYHDLYNKQWFEYTGLSYDETKGEGWNAVFHPDDQPLAWERWRHSLETGELYEVEYRCKRRDGEYRWFLGRATAIRDEKGDIVRWFGTCTDIHDHKLAQEELRRANTDLEQFAFSASHDLQEPLRMVAIYSQMIERKYRGHLDSKADEYIGHLVRGANQMELLLKDLLAYTRVANIAREGAAKPIESGAVVERVLSNLEAAIRENGASVTVEKLPRVRVEHVHLIQLLQNLVGNAIKYRSERPPKIHIRAERQGSQWRFSVEDNGIGIDRKHEKLVFGIFKRLHGQKYAGTGIGLAICQRIVERYGGRIWVESQVGKGSTFRFTLPGSTNEMKDHE